MCIRDRHNPAGFGAQRPTPSARHRFTSLKAFRRSQGLLRRIEGCLLVRSHARPRRTGTRLKSA
eukprot:6285850-Alexandrium_andersonii.AAC.1